MVTQVKILEKGYSISKVGTAVRGPKRQNTLVSLRKPLLMTSSKKMLLLHGHGYQLTTSSPITAPDLCQNKRVNKKFEFSPKE